jgi:signal transduction histidine kinase
VRASSIRLRLTFLGGVLLAVSLTAAGLILTVLFERHIERRLATELDTRWTELAALFAEGADGRPTLSREPTDPRYQQPYGGSYYQILGPDGETLRSRSLWDSVLPTDALKNAKAGDPPVEISGPDNSLLYLLALPVTVTDGQVQKRYVIAVAFDHAEVTGLSDSFANDVFLALGALAVLLVAGLYIQVGLGLAPLKTLRAELDRIRRGRATRLEGEFGEEVIPLVHDLNGLLDRQDQMIRRARDRAGTLAHGLKTPLTIITAEARRLDRAGFSDAAATLREQVKLMNGHVQRELARARGRGLSLSGGRTPDARQIVESLVGLQRRLPGGAAITWTVDIPAGLELRMEPDDFGEVIGNLLDNARKWAGSTVTVEASCADDLATVAVVDDGPGIPAALRQSVTARGVRGSVEVEGSGLGLAIVTDVLEEYAGTFALGEAPGGGCRATFQVPGWIATPEIGTAPPSAAAVPQDRSAEAAE